jgi:hypothetical protein
VDGGPLLVQRDQVALTAGLPGSPEDGVMAVWGRLP